MAGGSGELFGEQQVARAARFIQFFGGRGALFIGSYAPELMNHASEPYDALVKSDFRLRLSQCGV